MPLVPSSINGMIQTSLPLNTEQYLYHESTIPDAENIDINVQEV